MCLEIETTRDIARQILRHRSFAFQEFSQRYARADELDFEIRNARLQDTKNRQNSIEIDLTIDEQRQIAYQWENLQNDLLFILPSNLFKLEPKKVFELSKLIIKVTAFEPLSKSQSHLSIVEPKPLGECPIN